jgi:hypothetical protein
MTARAGSEVVIPPMASGTESAKRHNTGYLFAGAPNNPTNAPQVPPKSVAFG